MLHSVIISPKLPHVGIPSYTVAMKRPHALFLDIDGTILRSDHSLSPRVFEAITALKDAGTLVCLATGRSWESLKPIYDRLGLIGPTVCYNGAFIVEGPEGRRVFEQDLKEEVGRLVIQCARERNLEMVGFRHSNLIYEFRGPEIEAYEVRTGLSGSIVDYDELEQLEFTKAIIISGTADLHTVKAFIEGKFGPEYLNATFSDSQFLEFMGAGVDKGKGLVEVCRLHGIDVADSVAMGDGFNDLALLKAAGDAWVMGGAPEELKAQFPSGRHAPHADIDGAAMVMEAMLEEREPDFAEAEAPAGGSGS